MALTATMIVTIAATATFSRIFPLRCSASATPSLKFLLAKTATRGLQKAAGRFFFALLGRR
jgi:hypothetical protein